MKMISSTRQTSTSGVTLMSLRIFPLSAPTSIARSFPIESGELGAGFGSAPLHEIVQQLRGRIRHFDLEALDLVHEVVEHPDRRDGDEESESRRDEGLGNTPRDRCESA